MPRGYPAISREQEEQIIARIKDKGERVADLAKEYGVQPKTIYNRLRKTAGASGALFELSRLKREHVALLKIVGELVAEQRLGKKMRYGREY